MLDADMQNNGRPKKGGWEIDYMNGRTVQLNPPTFWVMKKKCDLLWWNREQVEATSFSLSRNQQCMLYISDTILSRSCGTPYQYLRLTLEWINYYKKELLMNALHEFSVCFVIDDVFIVKVLSRSMHRVGPILVIQYCLENENIYLVTCSLFCQSSSQN